MPPQNPSDRGYSQQPRWNESPGQPRWNDPSDQPRWNEAPADEAQTRPFNDQVGNRGPAPAAPRPPASRPPVSRRSILRGAGVAGAIGAAAAVGAGTVVALNRQSDTETLMPVSKPVAMAPMAPTAMEGPLVVYIADTTTGLLDVFGGTGATQVNNPALVKQLLANLKLA